jgi:nuclear pore complex protein Nup53
MSTTVQRTPKSGRHSLFFQDLASPVSARRGKFSTPGQAAAVSALWRENFSGSDLPPPPVFTLEDRSDFSPESGIPDYPLSPEVKSDPRTPIQSSGRDFSTSGKGKLETSTSYAMMGAQQNQQGSVGLSWWSPTTPAKSGSEQDEKGKNLPVEGVVQPVALITLPPPREVARPEIQRNCLPAGNLNEEEWVTVYGYCFILSFVFYGFAYLLFGFNLFSSIFYVVQSSRMDAY